ncbi:EAL and HDOD domain-containing protein [Cellulomonas soli]
MRARYIARQPIFDRGLKVVGYELLYRAQAQGPADVGDGTAATFSVLFEAFVELGLDATVQGVPAWVNVEPAALASGAHLVTDPARVVLELLETTACTPAVVAQVEELRAQGYTVALDDFVPDDPRTPLLDLVQVVKLELPAIPPGELAAQVAAVRRPGLTVLVEKIETQEQHVEALASGADLFQGYFFTRPQVLSMQSVTVGTPAVLAVLSQVGRSDVSMQELSDLVGSDVTLSQKVLQAVNSGFAGIRRRVDSIHQAVVLLGLERMRQLVTLVVLAGATGKPHELGRESLVRASMMVALLRADGRTPAREVRDAAFTVGLMSTLDAYTDTDIATVAERLSLTPMVRDAIVHHDGVLGGLLATVLAYEADELPDADAARAAAAYLEAVRDADARWAALEIDAVPGREPVGA